jgi:hypothetical protein
VAVSVDQPLDHAHRVLSVRIQLLCSDYRDLLFKTLEQDNGFELILFVYNNQRTIN